MGPGARLVSLANLSERYLGCRLDKEDNVRKSNWHMVLSGQQRECKSAIDLTDVDASNDVYASLQLHRALEAVGREHGITLEHDDLRRCCTDINENGSAMPGVGEVSPVAGTDVLDAMSLFSRDVMLADKSIKSWKPPSPAQLRAYERFRTGHSLSEIATERGIKVTTVRDYVLSTIITLRSGARIIASPDAEGPCSLAARDKERLLADIGEGYLTLAHSRLLGSIRAEVRKANGGDGAESASETEVQP